MAYSDGTVAPDSPGEASTQLLFNIAEDDEGPVEAGLDVLEDFLEADKFNTQHSELMVINRDLQQQLRKAEETIVELEIELHNHKKKVLGKLQLLRSDTCECFGKWYGRDYVFGSHCKTWNKNLKFWCYVETGSCPYHEEYSSQSKMVWSYKCTPWHQQVLRASLEGITENLELAQHCIDTRGGRWEWYPLLGDEWLTPDSEEDPPKLSHGFGKLVLFDMVDYNIQRIDSNLYLL